MVTGSGLRGWSIRCVSVAMSLAFCASVFAGSESSVSQPKKMQAAQKSAHKVCYVSIGGVPQPCDRFTGPIPTTAIPMEILGRAPQ
jgi:hypothetical protein